MHNFTDRYTAGELLAEKLINYKQGQDTIILALARGGVPVAHAIAENLELPLDVFLVRKLGLPSYKELAMGAIAENDLIYLDQNLIDKRKVSQAEIDAAINQEKAELQRRIKVYRQDSKLAPIFQQGLIVVDDGIATGATITAAIQALRQLKPKEIIVAVPVAAPESCKTLRTIVDDLVCLLAPIDFAAVGQYYEEFPQLEDSEVIEIIQQHRRLEKDLNTKDD